MASLITGAEQCEEDGDCAEALKQWETVRTICPAHPRLGAEIQRLKRLAQGQAPPDAPAANLRAEQFPAKRRGIRIAIAAVAALAGIVLMAVLFGESEEVEPGLFPVAVRTFPPGARISIDSSHRGVSDLDLELAPGSYALEASLAGYLSSSAALKIEAGSPASIDLVLTPLPASVRIVSDLARSQTTLDGESVEAAEENEIFLQNLSPGEHVVSVTGRYGEVTAPFTLTPGAAPALNRELEANEVVAIAVAQFGESVTVYCTCAPAPLMVDGAPAGDLAPEGLRLDSLPLGYHELTLGNAKGSWQVALDTTAAPALHLFLHSDRNVGAIAVVAADVDGVTVTLNGKAYRRTTRRGRLRLYSVPAGKHRVGVRKQGFEPVEEQTVQVSKGRVTTARFGMRPIPVLEELPAELVIEGALAGARISIDASPRGKIAYDGSFTATLDPGPHTITLSRETFRSRTLELDFSAGETVRLGTEDVALDQVLGILRLERVTADARVTIRSFGSSAADAVPLDQASARLAPGEYVISATAAGHEPMSRRVTVISGETTGIPVLLTAKRVERIFGMEQWEDAAGWDRQGVWYVRRGGNLVPYGASPVEGDIEFTARLDRGKRLRWFVNLINSGDYALFEIDAGSFYRHRVTKGKNKLIAKVSHARIRDNVYNVRIRISAGALVHQLRSDGEWVTIDNWTRQGRDFRQGKFGFYIRGRSQMGLSGFAYRPR